MNDRTILYLTDNSIAPALLNRCLELLLQAAGEIPIVSVSQEPMDLGRNICVGHIGRSGMSIDTQILIGLDAIDTRWVAVAEHDCVYSQEHFAWEPPDDGSFWYNRNQWFAQWYHPTHRELIGMYSHIRHRFAMSQLICSTESFRESSSLRHRIIASGAWAKKYPMGRIGEPGVAHAEKARKMLERIEHHYPEHERLCVSEMLNTYVTKYQARFFRTKTPNLDVRHADNFTGQRRGSYRTFDLPPWGQLESVLGPSPC